MAKVKQLLQTCFLLSLLCTVSLAKTPIGSFTTIIGSTLIKHDGDTGWVKGKIKMSIYDNDAIAVKEESQCEVTLVGDKVVRLGEKAMAVITEKTESQTNVKALKGALWINVKHLINNQSFDVTTSTAVAAIRGTVFGVQCDTNASKYSVFRGEVAVTNQPGKSGGKDTSFFVRSGEQFTLVKDMSLYMKEQEKALKDYLRQSNEEMENFSKDEQEQFEKYRKDTQEQIDKMLVEERAAFKTMDNMNYALKPIDEKKLLKNPWVEWNRGRDKELGW
jgi:hypothetical protein